LKHRERVGNQSSNLVGESLVGIAGARMIHHALGITEIEDAVSEPYRPIFKHFLPLVVAENYLHVDRLYSGLRFTGDSQLDSVDVPQRARKLVRCVADIRCRAARGRPRVSGDDARELSS